MLLLSATVLLRRAWATLMLLAAMFGAALWMMRAARLWGAWSASRCCGWRFGLDRFAAAGEKFH